MSARDVTGNEACSAETMFHVMGDLHLANTVAQPVVFSPDRDGTLDATTLSYALDESAEVVVSAPYPDGRAAELARRPAVAGTSSVTWDGTLPSGFALPEGRLTLEVAATGACGQAARATVEVDVDTLAPVVEVTAPAPGSRASADVVVTGAVRDAHLARWDVSVAPLGSASFQPIAGGTEIFWGVLGTVPVRDRAPGRYVVRVEASDSVGHSTRVDVPIDVVSGAILDRFAASPALVSPNGDGAFDSAVANVTLKQPASVSLDLVDASGRLVATALSGASLPAGPTAVPLDAALAAVRDDGDYVARITASAGGTEESSLAALAVDRTGPALSIAAPAAQACLAGPLAVEGGVDDPHLKRWTITLRTAGAPDALLASGTASVTGTLAVLAPASEGPHELVVAATDLVANAREVAIPFVADRTAPAVALAAPLDGAWVSGLYAPVDLTVDVADPNLVGWTASLDDGGGTRRELASGSAAGLATSAWDAGAEPEAAVTLVVEARDCAGNLARTQALVRVDHTLPVATIDAPRDVFARAPLAFTGTASDANLASWTLELAQGPASAAVGFAPVASGTASVASGTLGELLSLPADGLYTARLTVRDHAGNEAVGVSTFEIDSTPPRPPVLAAHVRRPNDGVLSWTASPDTDVVGYRVLRASGAGPFGVVTASLVTVLAWDDLALPDGTWRFAVVAVDASGLESVPSNEVSLAIDGTPPRVAISTPGAGAVVSGVVDVVGTAFSADDFKEYRLSVGAGEAPESFTLLRRSPAPVQRDLLGTVDAGRLPEGSIQTLRLEGEDLTGNVGEARVTIRVDNLAPAAPVLVFRRRNLARRHADLGGGRGARPRRVRRVPRRVPAERARGGALGIRARTSSRRP